METNEILAIIAGSSVLSAILTSFVSMIIESRKRTRTLKLASLQVSHILEAYAYSCVSRVDDHVAHDDSDGVIGKIITWPPEAPEIPPDLYSYVEPEILDEVLDFPLQVRFAFELVQLSADIGDSIDASNESCKNSLKLADMALQIADKIRSNCSNPRRSLVFGHYDIQERLYELRKKYPVE